MRSWKDWGQLMASDETIFRFMWIVEAVPENQSQDWEKVEEQTRELRGKKQIVQPAYERRYISLKNFNELVGEHVEIARAAGEA